MALAKLECLALAMALVNYVWLLILVSLTLLAGLLLVEAANLQMAARQEAEAQADNPFIIIGRR